ncbi:laminin subunit alpha-5 isoform X1 [Lepisosteus oculatus]|uniref:laminin subunit alpha-5 isoform X1 n=1 Tax=Lepisosteus oculatus TaxID=7918 RepID=UPI0035F50B7D
MARGPVGINAISLSICCFATIRFLSGAYGQELPTNGVNGFSLHPPYFNLAEGTKITATATCGEDENGRAIRDLYCKLVGGPVSGDPGQTIQGQYCDTCMKGDSDRAHPSTNAIDGTERWWQSPPLSRSLDYNEVNVTLDLGQLFHVAYVLIKFANSPRPDLWVLERSIDFGDTYQPWQFFASSKRDCIDRFGQRTIERITKDNDVICTSEYSRIVPLENGEIVVSLVNGRPGAMNFSYSPVLRDFTKATNIRLRFLRTNTLLGHLMGKALRDPTVTRRYYYSIKDISIGGRCVCNGHAEACNAKDPTDPYRLQCDCQHSTCGASCDRCCPGYNQMPWKPATTYSANECEPPLGLWGLSLPACNCNKHSFDCYYDPEVDERRASVNVHGENRGGGVCLECQHHTTGINCERCIPGYYRSPDHSIDSPLACSRCVCDSAFTDGTCEDLTGRCYCKPNYTGENCEACAEGYASFPECFPVPAYPNNSNGEALPAGEIINCECNAAGTEGNSCRPDPSHRACVCKPNFQGFHCDQCAPNYFGLNCQPCQCTGPGALEGSCDSETGQCHCRSGFEGYHCDRCAPGYFNYPLCQLCGCSTVGSLPEVCDPFGQCLCRPEFDGPHCEQCKSGFHSYPNCQVCSCDPRGSIDASCSASGHCHCHPNFSGVSCDKCAPGYYGYPSCTPCQCSMEGSRHSSCDQVTGQCYCLPSVVGQHCDTCHPGAYGFPQCQVGSCNPAGSAQNEVSPTAGVCVCRPYVEGSSCDRCKPLYWNLSSDVLYGCMSCDCNTEGTLSTVAECSQSKGQCFCKPNVCSETCSTCKDGFYNLERTNYFGCQGCQCDIGGSEGLSCEKRNGRCRCRPNIEGPKCTRPKSNHYFPDLHHLKFEIEDGTMLDGRPVRFGYNPLEFENFSWRGYAQMSPIQPKVVVSVVVNSPDLFHIVFRYVSRGSSHVRGRVSVLEEGKHVVCANCSDQSKQIIFAPSSEPSFVTVPQNNFVEPFVLNPGTWSVVIEAEGILLDYLVLLPSAYYEAPILQLKVTEPCTYDHSPEASQNCLLYKYLSLDGFPSAPGRDATCRFDNHLPRPCQTEKITPHHPSMAICSGNDLNVQFRIPVPRPGTYGLVLEYVNEDESLQTLTVSVNSPGVQTQVEIIKLYHCKYSFMCRVVSTDSKNRVGIFSLTTEADVQFIADRANFFLHKIYLIPHEQFTMEYVEPRVHCISTHGTFSPANLACVPSRFQTPSQSIMLREGQASSVPDSLPFFHESQVIPAERPGWAERSEDRPPTAADNSEHIRLDRSQNAVVYSTRVQTLGRYVFILHYHQPDHPTFAVQVFLNAGRVWQGFANATFCPHGYGCRSTLSSENKIILDVTDNDVFLTIRVPDGKTLWMDYVLVVPEGSYNPSYLTEEPLDKSYDFISNCGLDSFYINPTASSPFCKNSAISLSAFFNSGAQPCGCHEAGAEAAACEPFGGQCRCRPSVIGRDCSRCATGHWGFPNCRPCQCGTRLCDEVTGECICPPRTIVPECIVCQPQTFGCHPLVGCEECNCSRPGISGLTDDGCDRESGQCRCKTNIIGRRCDHCAPGFYGYPNCRPCDCSEAGTESGICDSVTGQCLCKENVEGVRCDQCRVGTFLLDPSNPKGCTSCFCFGATDRCRSSEKRRVELMDMNGWILLSGERQEVPISTHLERSLVEADLQDVPDVYQDLHWHAPHSYLGDKVSSYGGFLHYRLLSQTQPTRGDGLSLPAEAARPDVILKGNQMTLVYLEKEYAAPWMPHEGRVHLVEGSFRHARTGNAVSREELMMVLVGLEGLQIRALHSQSSLVVSLQRVVLEQASHSPTGTPASNVEICLCPASYHGDSCQECAPGYYRDTKGLFLGKCVPCNCNGHSDQCLHGSGTCVNCQHNTEGDHCEKCKTGFLGNSTNGQSQICTGCPCPLQVTSNNFAIGCVERTSRMQCLCMPGYAGSKCERCAPGFYGNPMVIGSSCRPCQCNDNTDPNMLFSDCDSLTGVCHGCMHNTAGPHCEICAPGYFGDAVVAKNCTKCDCSPCGTSSCDSHTGQCHCKPGVTGPLCDRCEESFYGYESCAGCRRCDCSAAAALTQGCNPQSGECSCQPGVNGPQCLQCAPGFWDYKPSGCKKCHCKGGSCDPRTGECRCSNGLTGKQCDTCAESYHIPVVNGADSLQCQPCDSCVIVLLEDLDKMTGLFLTIRGQLTNLNASSIAWTRLQALNDSVNNVTNYLFDYNNSLDSHKMKADELENEAMNLSADLDVLKDKATETSRKAETMEEDVALTHKRAEELLNQTRGTLRNIEDLIRQANRTALNDSSSESAEGLSRKLAEVEEMLREMRDRVFSIQTEKAGKELKEAKNLMERMQNELVSRLNDNEELVKSIRDKLGKFNAKLMDLRDALNEAVNKTAQAEELNNLNRNRLEDNREKIEELEGRKTEVQQLLQMAEEAVAQVNDLLSMLQENKEEYERLAAQLDGARIPLIEKVQKFGPSINKIELVEEAERHAMLLDELARNLSRVIMDTNQDGFIQRAINASKAYSSIIEAVRNAEKAANDANQAATEALKNVMSEDTGSKAERLKNKSNSLEEKAKTVEKKLLNDLKPQLQAAKKRLQDVQHKQRQLLKNLEAAQRSLNFSREETAEDIAKAKLAAAEANNTAANVEKALSPMKQQLEQWKKQYGNASETSMDFNTAFQEANKSVGMLGDTIPLLIKKLDSLQSRSIQMPNISENIQRIRQLISQARNAASKVNVPMKFNGTAGVQVRNPSNLADLTAYTSLKFYITLPEAPSKRQTEPTKQFVFYLGNKNATKEFLGMALEGKQLKWLYNVGGETAVVELNQDISSGTFDAVKLERILQFGQIELSVKGTVTQVTKQNDRARGDSGLLHLPPDETVFYVGGYPPSFTPPRELQLPNFKGCIVLDTLNQEVLSLYNFEQTFDLNTAIDRPCARSKYVPEQWVDDGAHFDGTGYAKIDFRADGGPTRRFEQEIKVLSYNAVLLLFQKEDQFLCLAVVDGELKVYYDFNGGMQDIKPEKDKSARISDGKSRQLEIILHQTSSGTKVIVRIERASIFIKQFDKPFPQFNDFYYLGGVPQDKMPEGLKALFPNRGSFKGCLRNVKALGKYVDLKRTNSSGVSYGCSPDLLVVRGAEFSGQGYLSLSLENVPSLQDNFYAGFGFRTSQKDGLMFYHEAQDGVCEVYLKNGLVVAKSVNAEVRSKMIYNDDSSHYVSLYSNSSGLLLYVDDDLMKTGPVQPKRSRHRRQAQLGSFYLGGSPASGSAPNLTGCISNLFVKRNQISQEVVDLLQSHLVNVSLNCANRRKPLPMWASPRGHKASKVHSQASLNVPRNRSVRGSCQTEQPRRITAGLQFSGSMTSHLEFSTTPVDFKTRFHFSMDIHLNSSDGLILYISGEKEHNVMTLSVVNGHFVLMVDGGRRKKTEIRSNKNYNDGLWHTVFVKKEKDKVRIVTDGLDVQSKRLPGGARISLSSPFYVGGIPAGKSRKLSAVEGRGFVGCIKGMKLDNVPLDRPSRSLGVVPCYEKSLQPGVYFASEGGHLTLDDSFVTGQDFEVVLEVKPVTSTGLLLHIGKNKGQFVSLYMANGEVLFTVDNGGGAFSASLIPEESLCNGNWHHIAIVKKNNVIQLDVDLESNHTVGPRGSVSSRTRAMAYLGGVPDTVKLPGLLSPMPSFHGCIRRVVMNQLPIDLSRPVSLYGAVGLKGCPVV